VTWSGIVITDCKAANTFVLVAENALTPPRVKSQSIGVVDRPCGKIVAFLRSHGPTLNYLGSKRAGPIAHTPSREVDGWDGRIPTNPDRS